MKMNHRRVEIVAIKTLEISLLIECREEIQMQIYYIFSSLQYAMLTIIVSNVLLRATIQTEAEKEESCMYGGVGMSKLVNTMYVEISTDYYRGN